MSSIDRYGVAIIAVMCIPLVVALAALTVVAPYVFCAVVTVILGVVASRLAAGRSLLHR